jgi:hypothetical protein
MPITINALGIANQIIAPIAARNPSHISFGSWSPIV